MRKFLYTLIDWIQVGLFIPYQTSKDFVRSFIHDPSRYPLVILILIAAFFVGIIEIIGQISFAHSREDSFRQASYVLEKYATSYEALQSTDHFLLSSIDVAETEDGKDVVVIYDSPDGGRLFPQYFHVNPDFSYRCVEKNETVFVAH